MSDTLDAAPIVSVSELTHALREVVGGTFGEVGVRGELGRVTYHGSGHVYLSLKDADAVLSAVIWRSTASRLRFRLEEGQEVVAFGGLDVYAPRGTYQLIIRAVEPLGEGALRRAFEQLRRRLDAEGLFDEAGKQALPDLPKRIALITSPTGAAVRDLIEVIHRRLPAVQLLLVPVRVQGEEAAGEIAHAIRFADREARADVIIVGRGGGSLEDLWAFNEEVVARAIHASKTPIVSAVGHETDVTISDLVADVRAATPSQAGELVVPEEIELRRRLAASAQQLERGLRRRVDAAWQQIEALADRPVLRDPANLLRGPRERTRAAEVRLRALSPLARLRERQARVRDLGRRLAPPLTRRLDRDRSRLDDLGARGLQAVGRGLTTRRASIAAIDDALRALSPLGVLGRGYALATGQDGRIVRTFRDVRKGETLVLRIGDGSRIESLVEKIVPPRESSS